MRSKKYFVGELVMENILTLKELATYLKLKESTVRLLASRKKLPGFKIGNSWRFEMGKILMLFPGGKKEERPNPALRKNEGSQ